MAISNVVRWQNGMVMVFDERGDQLPEYQGRWDDVKDAILRDKPPHVEVEGPRQWRNV